MGTIKLIGNSGETIIGAKVSDLDKTLRSMSSQAREHATRFKPAQKIAHIRWNFVQNHGLGENCMVDQMISFLMNLSEDDNISSYSDIDVAMMK